MKTKMVTLTSYILMGIILTWLIATPVLLVYYFFKDNSSQVRCEVDIYRSFKHETHVLMGKVVTDDIE